MSIRKKALTWLNESYENTENLKPVYTSKYYLPGESWSKTSVWWVEIPEELISSAATDYVHILCETFPEEDDFFYLKIPVSFLKENKEQLFIRDKKISIYFSTDDKSIFIDQRGNGLDFSQFEEFLAGDSFPVNELPSEMFEEAIVKLPRSQRIVLSTLYGLPNSSATAKELAAALGYKGFQAANSQIGLIGKSIAKNLNLVPPNYDSGHARQSAYFLFVGDYKKGIGWVMWEGLKEAMENLNLDSLSGKELKTENITVNEAAESANDNLYKEGILSQYFVNRYSRNKSARAACVKFHKSICAICDFNFGNTYGSFAEGFIHVHHVTQISDRKEVYLVDPVKDLIPLCPNCHSAIHLSPGKLSVEELRNIVLERRAIYP